MSSSARSAIRSVRCSGIRYISAKPPVPAACPRTCPHHPSRKRLTPFQLLLTPFTVFSVGLYWYGERYPSTSPEKVWNKALKIHMEEKGVNRELCEATIAELKHETEAGLTSEAHRYLLRMYEDWLQVLTRDSS